VQRVLVLSIFLFFSTITSFAQFNNFGLGEDGGSGGIFGGMNMNSSSENDTISATQIFSIKDYFRGLAHKDTLKMSWMFGGSLLLPGSAQIYNKDYWKLPVIYVSIGGFAAGGGYFLSQYKKTGNKSHKTASTLMFAGAALCYWGSIMDGIVSYDSPYDPDPTRATLYSLLLPGLGQIYNKDYWHIPIWYTGLAVAGYAWNYNAKQYTRYRDQYNQATDPNNNYTGSVSVDNLKHYRDTYRRMRDYSILATAAVYLLQVIDANVFATMHGFEISDDLSVDLQPAIISPIGTPNLQQNLAYGADSFGLQLNLSF
jgi:hypothetical protein